jgi:hypothetical protein
MRWLVSVWQLYAEMRRICSERLADPEALRAAREHCAANLAARAGG